MHAYIPRRIRPILALASLACSCPVLAAWTFQEVGVPGNVFTEVFGLNNQGQVVGVSATATDDVPFVYNARTRQYTAIAPVPGEFGTVLMGISENGTMAGAVTSDVQGDEAGFIRDKDGSYTVFSHPGSTFTEPRGINDSGVVSGYADTPDGYFTAFAYDSRSRTFTDFVRSCFTVAHGINSQGEIAGSALFNTAFGCPSPDGSLTGTHAWVRSKTGDVTYFRVNGLSTSARGINERGLITGAVRLPSGDQKGFITTVAAASSGSVTIADGDLLDFPGHGTTSPEGINDKGVVAGIILDTDPVTGEVVRFGGFVATGK